MYIIMDDDCPRRNRETATVTIIEQQIQQIFCYNLYYWIVKIAE